MIDFRYHLVSIVAVFLALAIGIVIGAAALRPTLATGLNVAIQLEHRINVRLNAQKDALVKQLAADDAFARADYQYLLGGLLTGQQVVVVTAPGADGPTVSAITAALRQAGATVTGQVSLQPSFFDTGAATETTLAQLAASVAPAEVSLGGAASPISGQQAAATVLAAAIMAKDGPVALTARQRQTILDGLGNQGYLQLKAQNGGSTLANAANLAVVVSPATPRANDGDPANQVLTAVTQKLAGPASNGAVLAGTVAGSGPGSAIDDITSGAAGVPLATVDDADTTIGQIMVVQALRLLLQPGAKPAGYGVGPGSAPSPAPSTTPSLSPSTSPSVTPSPSKHRKRR